MNDLSKIAPRPPFANYDLVVYFGGGLFTLPLLQHFYFGPLGLSLQSTLTPTGDGLIDSVLTILFFLFFAYLVGHALAYASGQIIQKAADNVFGKTSGVIIWESLSSDVERKIRTRQLIRSHVAESLKRYNWPATPLRLLFHAPLIPVYFAIYFLGTFGFYASRVPKEIVELVRKRLRRMELPDIPVAHRGYWFKPLEHYVMNNYPVATARMYNYLVIAGLFRSLALIFLISIWLEIYYGLHYALDGHWWLTPILGDVDRAMPLWQLYFVLVVTYLVSLFSFLKFQRRYAEEAIFAFALTNDLALQKSKARAS